MIVCVDVGNTTICFGLYDNNKLIDTYKIVSKLSKTSDEYGSSLLTHYKLSNIDKSFINGAIIASVVPSVDHALENMFLDYFHVEAMFINSNLPLGLNLKVNPVSSLGADLLVGAYIATIKYGVPNIVIDMGTATTLIVVNKNKELLGGIIYPGVIASFSSLIKATSLLESTKLEIPDRVIENNTKGCLQSGMTYGTKATITGLVEMMKQELNEENIKVIMTGGISKVYKKLFNEYIYDENLLLEGLYEIYNLINK